MTDEEFVLNVSARCDLSVDIVRQLLKEGWTFRQELGQPNMWLAPIAQITEPTKKE